MKSSWLAQPSLFQSRSCFLELLKQRRREIADKAPVVLNLTNFVAMDFTANVLLSVGAAPVMAHAEEEIEELVAQSHAVVINSGTPDPAWWNRARFAARAAARFGRPVVFDPVGAGATEWRTRQARALIEDGTIATVRGNASELRAVLGGASGTRGVDSRISSGEVAECLRTNSRASRLVLAASGAVDFIAGGGQLLELRGGSRRMTEVTAMGCASTSLIAAFCAVCDSSFEATSLAMALMKLVGSAAESGAHGPGSFRSLFLDRMAEPFSNAPIDEALLGVHFHDAL